MTTLEPLLVDSGPALTQAGLVHRVHAPAAPGPHPTAVFIHGRSGNENVTWVFARTLPSNWLIVAPRALKSDPDGGYSWHPRRPDHWPTLATFQEAADALRQFIRALPTLYAADPDRIYLLGFSQGAAVAYATALYHPGLAQGIAGLVGFMPEGVEAAPAASFLSLPVFMAVGRQDPTIPLGRAQACAQILRDGGADLDYHEYDTGHKLNAAGLHDLRAWWHGH